jgi:uncharacterized membrane protein YdjX (TVP38/TMEM64 family)
MNPGGNGGSSVKAALSFRRVLPIIALLAGLGLVYALGLHEYLSCDALRDNRAELNGWVQQNRLLAVLAFMFTYVAAVALSVPGGAALTVGGGFLFGTGLATMMVVVAATLGATILFLAARTAFGDLLRAKAGPWLGKLERGFAENALSYLLVLRLVPLFPFFVVNLVPAFLGVSPRVYVMGTLIGIIPGTFVFASVGAGLGSIFDAGGECSLDNALTTEVVIALAGLAALSLIPVVYKKLFARPASIKTPPPA